MATDTQSSNEVTPTFEEIQQSEWNLYDKYYNRKEVEDFLKDHRVEVVRQDDYQLHCYIDYTKGDGSWYSTMFNPFTALVIGIIKWKEHNK